MTSAVAPPPPPRLWCPRAPFPSVDEAVLDVSHAWNHTPPATGSYGGSVFALQRNRGCFSHPAGKGRGFQPPPPGHTWELPLWVCSTSSRWVQLAFPRRVSPFRGVLVVGAEMSVESCTGIWSRWPFPSLRVPWPSRQPWADALTGTGRAFVKPPEGEPPASPHPSAHPNNSR